MQSYTLHTRPQAFLYITYKTSNHSYTLHTRHPSNLIHYTQDLQAILYITHKTSKQSYTLHTRPPSILIHYTQDLQAILYITHKTSKQSRPPCNLIHRPPCNTHKTSKQYIIHSYTLHTRLQDLIHYTQDFSILIHYTQDLQAI